MGTDKKWLALRLTYVGEQTDQYILNYNLCSIFGKSIEVFFPFKAPKETYSNKLCVLDGYVFISDIEETDNILLRSSYYFEEVSTGNGYVPDAYIKELKKKMKSLCEVDFDIGDYVNIIDGPYSSLDGKIVRTSKENIVVQIAVRSRVILVEIPKISIKKLSSDDVVI